MPPVPSQEWTYQGYVRSLARELGMSHGCSQGSPPDMPPAPSHSLAPTEGMSLGRVLGLEAESLRLVEGPDDGHGAWGGGQHNGELLHLLGCDGLDAAKRLVDVLEFAGH